MEDKISILIEKREDRFIKVCFSGERYANEWINSWMKTRSLINCPCEKILIIDNMQGEIITEGICLLTEMLSEYNFYREKKIAVVLKESNSYSAHFFDVFAKNWGLNIKHFIIVTEALEWLKI